MQESAAKMHRTHLQAQIYSKTVTVLEVLGMKVLFTEVFCKM